MADVRRPVTWEDLGYVRDHATGQWSEAVVRASRQHLTWEDVGFVQDRSGRWMESDPPDLYLLRDPYTGGWIEGGQKAARELLASRGHKFDPHQLRDPHTGEWIDTTPGAPGSGVIADPLKLAGRIQLGPGERFRGSAKAADSHGDFSAVMARIDGPDGPKLRFGSVLPEEHEKWRAANRGNTVELDRTGTRRLQDLLAGTADAGKASVKDYGDKVRAAHAAGLPADQWPDPEATIADGVIPGNWGDVKWSLTREYGSGAEIHGAPAVTWNLAISTETAAATFSFDDFNLQTPSRVRALEQALAGLMDAE